MNERQRLVAAAIAAAPNGVTTAEAVAHRLGARPARKGILSATSTLRAMERAGLVARIPPADQWCSAHWCLLGKAKAELAAMKGTAND